jgi:preprotein translocase subunit SecA
MDRMGLEEGEVIQHSMISNSIERAQKKVEENNFGTRKRLLEYDDVMNAQREVVYRRRRNALYGERLELDIWNMIFDTAEDVAISHKLSGDYEDFKLAIIRIFGFDTAISETDMASLNQQQLTERLYNEALAYYISKTGQIAEHSYPIISDLYQNRGAIIENVAVPFSDGRRQMTVVANLKKTYESHSKELIREMEKIIVLATIDTAWTQHLREMDDLKQSVQNAVYEQKDPLLIYKFESFELFKRMIGKVNEETVSFLFKADIPVNEPEEVQEARAPRAPQKSPALKLQKEEAHSSLDGGTAAMPAAPEPEKVMPVRAQKMAGRNDKVSVRYHDGRVVRDVKFKTVEQDVLNNRCVIIED